MRFLGGNQSDSLQRYFPVAPSVVFKALLEIVPQRFTLKTTDDFTLSCTFSSGASVFTWGENFSAQVVPAEGGATLNVQGAGRVGGQIQQSARTNKLIGALFEDITPVLRAAYPATQ
jgi:hypothetical protein